MKQLIISLLAVLIPGLALAQNPKVTDSVTVGHGYFPPFKIERDILQLPDSLGGSTIRGEFDCRYLYDKTGKILKVYPGSLLMHPTGTPLQSAEMIDLEPLNHHQKMRLMDLDRKGKPIDTVAIMKLVRWLEKEAPKHIHLTPIAFQSSYHIPLRKYNIFSIRLFVNGPNERLSQKN